MNKNRVKLNIKFYSYLFLAAKEIINKICEIIEKEKYKPEIIIDN